MSGLRLIFLYSGRILKREWRRFVLPLTSLLITSVVLVVILHITSASTQLLADQARELQGGDVVLESSSPIDGTTFFTNAGIEPTKVSEKIDFSGTLQSPRDTAPFSIEVVDATFPLYGTLILSTGIFEQVRDDEIYLETSGADRLGVTVGDKVSFGNRSFTVAGIVVTKPTSLFGGFSFLPTAFINSQGFSEAGVDAALLRVEYTYAVIIPELSDNAAAALKVMADANPLISVNIAGQGARGLQFGLATVSDFLVVAVLITAVLAAVNVYASIIYLVAVERKSLAVLLALGLTKNRLIAILGCALMYVVTLASIFGSLIGIVLFRLLQNIIETKFLILLPTPDVYLYSAISSGLIFLIALMSFIPAIRKSLELNPKQILTGQEGVPDSNRSFGALAIVTISTLVPLVLLAGFLLNSLTQGLFVIGAIAATYVVVAVLYTLFLRFLYSIRGRFPFFVRSIISQKYADGLFGVVSFASLFIALAAICSLSLTQISLERFLTDNLSATVPSNYILDVQPSQKDELMSAFPDITLFSNIRARIIAIDTVRIQDELEADNAEISRELGREFNLTARPDLLPSETILAGTWSFGMSGEISVDADFAKQANISLGSNMTFSIQGFEVSGVVTSLRSTDSRSGLPFFYFVMAPADVSQFPSVYFGYSYYETTTQAALGRFLADTMPNVSMIETQTLGPLLLQIVGTLLVLVLIVTLPPLLIATLLIAMLVISSYSTRRREGARLRTLGLTRRRSFWLYILETIALTVAAAVLAYLLGVGVAAFISLNFLNLSATAWFDSTIVTGLGLIIFFVFTIAWYLYRSDKIELRELLSYE